MKGKHIAALALAVFGGYQLLIAQIPAEGASALEALTSGSDSLSGVISAELASGQLIWGGGALGFAYYLGFRL